MEKIIWTLWWQGKDSAPVLVKKCMESMRLHSGDAKLIILDQNNICDYIHIPTRVQTLFNAGKITITHLSDIIRFRLLHQYGGLWLDSTIYVAEDIPNDVFTRDFYTIRKGAGGDKKSVSQERWTSFLIGGKAGNTIFESVNRLFDQYWAINDELICYSLIDFALNEVYESVAGCKEIIDSVPLYEGNVLALMGKIKSENDIGTIFDQGVFHKLSYKEIGKSKTSRMKSLWRHIKNLFCIRKWKKWGIKVAVISFLSSCTRTSKGNLGIAIAKKYNKIMGGYWADIGRLMNNQYNQEG